MYPFDEETNVKVSLLEEIFLNIHEIIVVEGKSDTQAITRAVHADTIETNGSAVSEETLQAIEKAFERRGVIVLTDPDYPGQRIRHIVTQRVPGAKQAFIDRKQAHSGTPSKSLGVEHASIEAIQEALLHVYTPKGAETAQDAIPQRMLIQAGLIGGPTSRARRKRLGELLRIGYTNGKQLQQRLRMFQITHDEVARALETMDKEGLS